MSLPLEQFFSMSVPFVVTNGAIPVLDDTTMATVTSQFPGNCSVVYPDPTAGVANPLRSFRADMKVAPGGSTITISCLGHDATVTILGTPPVNRGTTTVGVPGAPFPTPAP